MHGLCIVMGERQEDVMNTATPIKDAKIVKMDLNNPTKTLNAAREAILELRKENESLQREIADLRQFREMAYQDSLSGLMNRRAFDKDIAREMARANRQINNAFSVMLIDLNDFKAINDERGHQVGDDVIKWVATFLKTQVRLQDVVYRLGGDEFAILMPDTLDKGARAVMTRIMEVLHLCNMARPFPVRMSLGASTYKVDGNTPDKLLDVADKRMYQSKKLQKAALRRQPTPPMRRLVS